MSQNFCAKKPYTKPALTIVEQVQRLQKHGLIIGDISKAEEVLNRISYFRLSAYWYTFREDHDLSELTGTIKPNTSLEQVLELYEFDRKLRLLTLDAI